MTFEKPLIGKVAVVTGASRGIGRGIALQLGEAGATVYVTGRPPHLSFQSECQQLPTLQKTAEEITDRGGKGVAAFVDHSNMSEVENLFRKVAAENHGTIDILVNNAFSAVSALSEVRGKKFWETDATLWDEVNNVGLRNHYFCSVYAARMMVASGHGLIVNVGSAGALKYFLNVPYGVGKCALDRMSADMAEELKDRNVAVISLWPGYVRTELCTKLAGEGKFDGTDLENYGGLSVSGESPEFSGKAVVALASDPCIMEKSGRTYTTGDLGITYGFKDVDGRSPPSLRSIKFLLSYLGYTGIASYFPNWIRVPGWILTVSSSRL
ncbi:hypothetical protein AB6A40_004161 [Gnathostoma spinigerum]|uniref:Dehydrogenase/reductase SDR family member 1 n=1 Tax=Gnathostoma spinigerum TaxID=75299 RepID=A0ABD6ELK7_9BILA